MTTLDELLPRPAYRISASRLIAADRQLVWNELVGLPMGALPVGFALTLVRHLPDVLLGVEKRVRSTDTFLDATPIALIISDEPNRLVSAGPSQAWKLFGAQKAPVLDAAGFRSWREPGWIRVAMEFTLTDVAGATLLSTETRIGVNDARTARAFRFYWWAIRAGSVLIRREVVARVRRRAEAR